MRGWGGFNAQERRLLVDLLLENAAAQPAAQPQRDADAPGSRGGGRRPGLQPDPPGAGDRPQGGPDRSGPGPHHRPDAAGAAVPAPDPAARRHPVAAGAGRRGDLVRRAARPGGEPRAAAGCSRRACCCCSSLCWGRSSASWSPTPSRSPSSRRRSTRRTAIPTPFRSPPWRCSAMLLFGRNIALTLSVLFSLLAARLTVRRRGALDRLLQPRRLARRDLHPGALPVPAPAGDGAGRAGRRRHQPDDGADPDRLRHRRPRLRCRSASTSSAPSPAGCWSPPPPASPSRSSNGRSEITTDIKLVELSNTNLPLLRRLAFEAPGTFQHSLMVANLAKEGCEAIGADPVLAYTAGLYHDVGKVLRPDYFVENQRPGHNRHDKLLPSMSALILINHVKDGVELARAAQPAAGDRRRHPAAPRHAADQVLLQQGPGAEGPRRHRRHRGEVPLSGPQAAEQGDGRADDRRRRRGGEPDAGGADRRPRSAA